MFLYQHEMNIVNQIIFAAYIPPHLRGGNQRSADSCQDNYSGGRSGGRGIISVLSYFVILCLLYCEHKLRLVL